MYREKRILLVNFYGVDYKVVNCISSIVIKCLYFLERRCLWLGWDVVFLCFFV